MAERDCMKEVNVMSSAITKVSTVGSLPFTISLTITIATEPTIVTMLRKHNAAVDDKVLN